MDYEIVVIVMRGRQALGARHGHWWLVARTSKRTSGSECSDTNPCSDANQDQRSDNAGQKGSLAHLNSPSAPGENAA
jgi:hypothetical protein